MHLAILTRQIGHYHDARYRGAAAAIDRVTVISTANQGGFAEFLAADTGAYAVEKLFPDRAAYDAGVASGALRTRLEETLARLSPDVIAISGWSNPESMIAIRWARERGVRLVMMSETQGDDAARFFLREAVKKRIVSACDAALVGGPPQAAYIRQLGIPESRVFMGYNAVDNAHFAAGALEARSKAEALRKEHGLPDRYILASCRFIAKKNLPNLVSAYADVVGQRDKTLPDLLILGDGDTRAEIEHAARAGGVEAHVHLPGYRGYEVLPALYALADLFVHVSTVEQWGLVINEAMASGTPVLASEPCGATRSLILDGENGIVVAPTREGIAHGLSRFFALSEEQREAMADAAASTIAGWGPDRFGSGMKSAAEAALAAPARGKLAPWDAAIFSKMEKTIVETVS